MAAYSTLIRKITTAEINRVQREGNYTRWAYFIDESTVKVGVVFANDTTFGAYTVADEPDPKLNQYGLEQIHDLTLTADPYLLVLTAGENQFQAVVFMDPATVLEDELLPSFSYAAVTEWQQFMRDHGVDTGPDSTVTVVKKVFIGLIVAAIVFIILGLITNNLSVGEITGNR